MRDITHGRRLFVLCFQVRLFLIVIGCSFVSVGIAALILPSVIILYTAYMCVYLCLKIKYGTTINRPNGLDIMYWLDFPVSSPYLNTVSTVEGDITIADLVERVKFFLTPEALNKFGDVYKRTWQRLETHFGYIFFRDDPSFDIVNHFVIVTNKELFDGMELEEYYNKIVSNKGEDSYGEFIKHEGQVIGQRMMELYGNKVVSRDKPQWEIVVYFHPNCKRVTFMFHGHHCLSDGVGVLRFLLENFGDKKSEYTLPYTFYQDRWYKRWAVNLLAFCMLPFGIWRLTYHTGDNPLNGPALTGTKMFVKSRPYSVAKMREIKNKCGCSMITLLFNSLAYALRCNYERRGCNVRKTLALVPVPLQNFNKPPVFKNDHGLQGILLRTGAIDVEKDSAMSRLDQTTKLVYISVRDPSFLPIQWMLANIGPLLPQSILKKVFNLKGFTTSLSNISGPENERFTICDQKATAVETFFWVPDREPMGMGFSSVGYMGECTFGLMVDKALMKNYREAYIFLEDFIQEFENLRKELNLSNSDS